MLYEGGFYMNLKEQLKKLRKKLAENQTKQI